MRTVTFSLAQIQVARNIVSAARQFRAAALWTVPDLIVLAVTKQECNWDDTAVGDSGQSFGPFQLYQAAHPNTDQLAVNPWGNYGMNEIYQRWETTWQSQSGLLVWNDITARAQFLVDFAPQAQGSIAWTLDMADNRYAEALAMLEIIS